jgi:pimeloyl-ACP methyl ester carboxylesterase
MNLQQLNPHYFIHESHSLAYYDEGAGEPVVLIHGFASNAHVNWVYTGWFDALLKAGFRVIAIDNRGHGLSEKIYDKAQYSLLHMASDVNGLLKHLNIPCAHIMGYSMGARITSYVCAKFPQSVKSGVIAGMGMRLIEGVGNGENIAVALEAASAKDVADPHGRLFRVFAEQTKSDLNSLAACVRGSRGTLERADLNAFTMPMLVVIGTKDTISGEGQPLADLFQQGQYVALEGKNHMNAVGDKQYINSVIEFWKN